MAIFKRDLDVTELIGNSSGGINKASFVEIRDSLKNLMKDIYGDDIDLSEESVDGQYIYEIALLLNNMFNVIDYGHKQLNPNKATDNYLDLWCSLANITRKSAKGSVAQLYVKNISGVKQSNVNTIKFVDRNNYTWSWVNTKLADGSYATTWEDDEIVLLTNVVCDTTGAIEASGTNTSINDIDWETAQSDSANGTIYQTVSLGEFEVYQESDAVVGNNKESDNELRERLQYSNGGNQSITLLASLKNALLSVDSLDDCYIYNNNQDSKITLNDDTVVNPHDIYCVLRYDNISTINEGTLGKTIYNKLTPGVKTAEHTNDYSGINRSYTITSVNGQNFNLNWKRALPYSSDGTLATITLTDNTIYNSFAYNGITAHRASCTIEENIRDAIIKALNKVKIGTQLNTNTLIIPIKSVDTKNEYFIEGVSYYGDVKSFDLNLNYLDIHKDDILFTYGKKSGVSLPITITISNDFIKYIECAEAKKSSSNYTVALVESAKDTKITLKFDFTETPQSYSSYIKADDSLYAVMNSGTLTCTPSVAGTYLIEVFINATRATTETYRYYVILTVDEA